MALPDEYFAGMFPNLTPADAPSAPEHAVLSEAEAVAALVRCREFTSAQDALAWLRKNGLDVVRVAR